MKFKLFIWIALLGSGLLFQGCFSSATEEEEQTTETTNESTNRSSSSSSSSEKSNNDQEEDFDGEINSIGDLTKAFKQLEKNVSQLQSEDGEPVEITDFRELKALMPNKLVGLKRVSNNGEKNGFMGFKISQAEAKYKDGDQQIEVEIVDFAGVSMIKAGLAAWTTVEVDRESDNEYEKTYIEDGNKVYEKFNFKTKRGEINSIIDERYLVNIQTRNLTKKQLESVRNTIDVSDLN